MLNNLRNIGKMNYHNNGSRSFLESIANIDIQRILEEMENREDFIIVGGLAVSFFHKPYRVSKISIIANKPLKTSPYIDIIPLPENLDYNDILSGSIRSDGFNIINPTDCIILYNSLNTIDREVIAEKIIYTCSIDLKRIESFGYKIDEEIIKNKNYQIYYMKNFNRFNESQVFEGTSGYPEVDTAFADWIKRTKETYPNQVLIGGMAFINHITSVDRTTQDVDFLFLSKEDIPSKVIGFSTKRKGAFQHDRTHVEIETLSPESINLKDGMIEIIFDEAYEKNGYKIASPSSIVALKLERFNSQDKLDIKLLMNDFDINIDRFIPYLSEKSIENWNSLK